MNGTALGANTENIIFISEAHEKFYYEKLKEVRCQDVYNKALIYCLGICNDTRNNIYRIFDFQNGLVKPKCLNEGWQTSGSVRVVRMAFNLFCNGMPSVENYRKKDDQLKEAACYSVEDLFCCSYAPYFWQAVPTEQGKKLILVLPDIVKSPKLTADWENKLTLVAKGELSDAVFMGGIDAMIQSLIEENKQPKEEYRALFPQKAVSLGICPHCGEKVLKGKYGAYCSKKCGMNVSRYFGTPFTDEQVADLLSGKKILLKGVIGKNGKPYDMYLQPKGIEEYSYEKSFPKKSHRKKHG